MFSRWSNEKVQFYTLACILGGMLIYLMIQLLEVSIRCVDEYGCLLERCALNVFSTEYANIIDVSLSQNKECPFRRGSTRNVLIGRFGGGSGLALQTADTCQPTQNAIQSELQKVEKDTALIDVSTSLDAALQALLDSDSSLIRPTNMNLVEEYITEERIRATGYVW